MAITMVGSTDPAFALPQATHAYVSTHHIRTHMFTLEEVNQGIEMERKAMVNTE